MFSCAASFRKRKSSLNEQVDTVRSEKKTEKDLQENRWDRFTLFWKRFPALREVEKREKTLERYAILNENTIKGIEEVCGTFGKHKRRTLNRILRPTVLCWSRLEAEKFDATRRQGQALEKESGDYKTHY